MSRDSMGFTSAVRGATDASHNLGDAVFQHADAIQHLSDALEEEVSLYARELGARIAMLHDGAHQITSAGLAIARAGDRLAACGEHVALGMQQMVIVIAASMLTIVTGLFGWRYLVLGCVVLWLCGFEVKHLQRSLLPGRRTQEHQEQHHVPPHSDGAHLPSALHNPAGIISPKRVSWEQGIDGSQGTTDSGIPTPHSEQGQSPRAPHVGIIKHQGLDGVYISSNLALPPPTAVVGDGSAALAAGAQAAARDGVATLRSGGIAAVRSGDSTSQPSMNGSMPAAQPAAEGPLGAIGADRGTAGVPVVAPDAAGQPATE